ncbi:MAG: hypothetical protein LQ347_000637 [Umbilicaria vellea]|nr:MAG: hypothetical protein LQ347_000637 [Umbilicaria vellea]
MATLTFQRATWCLQISRTSRTFAVSFTTALPHRGEFRKLPSDATNPLRSNRHDSSRARSSRHSSARTAFTSTRVHQAQQAGEAAATAAAAAPAAPAATPARPRYANYAPKPPSVTAGTAGTTSQPATSSQPPTDPLPDLTNGFDDTPVVLDEGSRQVDWARSFHGLSTAAFSKEAASALLQPIPADDIEIKPDGIIYLPEIKYRRILNRAFGPGGWGLAPRGETIVTAKAVTREYALLALGRLVSLARGEQEYFSPDGIPTSAEGCKSNALMRCCKDLGVASELWDPRFIRKFMREHGKELFVEHAVTKKRKKIWMRKDDEVRYPFKETKGYGM